MPPASAVRTRRSYVAEAHAVRTVVVARFSFRVH